MCVCLSVCDSVYYNRVERSAFSVQLGENCVWHTKDVVATYNYSVRIVASNTFGSTYDDDFPPFVPMKSGSSGVTGWCGCNY